MKMDGKQQSKKNSHSALNKAVKNINKLIQDGDLNVKNSETSRALKAESTSKTDSVSKSKAVAKVKNNGSKSAKKALRVYPDRGVVYLGHIPHGFYEEEMKAFFGQFGHVTRLRLVRSNKTGNSRGYAFVEFRFTEVAQVVAETMNNYLMRNRLMKATYIPPEKQTSKMFLNSTNYGPETCIGVINQRRAVKNQNKTLSEGDVELRVNRHKEHLIELQEKLKAQGVDCLFQVDEGTSKRLLKETEPSTPAAKKMRTSSPAPKVNTAKTPVIMKQTASAPLLKKQSVSSKGQNSQDKSKTLKKGKSVDKVPQKLSLKNDKKKISEKKPKKVVKKSIKTGPPKKDLKKATVKKSIVKKK